MLDEEYGVSIKSSLDNLSEEGRESLRTKLEEFKPTADNLDSNARGKGFLEILTNVFKEFGGDYEATGKMLSVYA